MRTYFFAYFLAAIPISLAFQARSESIPHSEPTQTEYEEAYKQLQDIAMTFSPKGIPADATAALIFSYSPDVIPYVLQPGRVDPNQPIRYWSFFSSKGMQAGAKEEMEGGAPTVETPAWQIAALTGCQEIITVLLQQNTKLQMKSIDGVPLMDILKGNGDDGKRIKAQGLANAKKLLQANGSRDDLFSHWNIQKSGGLGWLAVQLAVMMPPYRQFLWLQDIKSSSNEVNYPDVEDHYAAVIHMLEERTDLWL